MSTSALAIKIFSTHKGAPSHKMFGVKNVTLTWYSGFVVIPLTEWYQSSMKNYNRKVNNLCYCADISSQVTTDGEHSVD